VIAQFSAPAFLWTLTPGNSSTVAPAARASRAVSSVQLFGTTMISSRRGAHCSRSARTVAAMEAASL
jgi:hypothetical protein